MKNLLLVFALLLGSIGFSQGVVITNNTDCVKYVRAQFVMPDCSYNAASPSGWVALAPGATLNFGGSHVDARLLRVMITGGSIGTCGMFALDNILDPCWTGPLTGSDKECDCEGLTYIADITNDGWDNFIDIHY